jgi:hypothetical protein
MCLTCVLSEVWVRFFAAAFAASCVAKFNEAETATPVTANLMFTRKTKMVKEEYADGCS